MTVALDKSNLDSLAVEIDREHEAVKAAFQTGIEHAIKAGELLIEAKKEIPHGNWEAWVQINCSVKKRMAQNYMKLAREVPKLDAAKAQALAHLGVEATLNALAIPSANATRQVTIAGEYEVVEISDSTKPAPTFVGRPPSTGDATRAVSSDPPADPLHVSEVLKMLQKLWWRLTEEERRVFLHWARREGKKPLPLR